MQYGTKEDYQRIFGDRRLEYVLRGYTGLEEEAAKAAFSQLIQGESMNKLQRSFIQTLIDHVVRHGMVENLFDSQNFRSFQNLDQMFSEEQLDIIFEGLNRIKPQVEEQ